jgi:hypothetical protein
MKNPRNLCSSFFRTIGRLRVVRSLMFRMHRNVVAPLMIENIGLVAVADTPREDLLRLIAELHPRTLTSGLARIGPDGDGGYLIPENLNGILACFSPGISNESGFERDCADRGIQIFMADASVDKPATPHELFSFSKKFIGAWTHGEYISMDDWVSECLPQINSDLLLQMDIEGAEYESLLAMSAPLTARFRVIVIEFHLLDQLWSQSFFRIASAVFRKLLHTHACVHIHPNNFAGVEVRDDVAIPRLAEFTFVRLDHVNIDDFAVEFPHPLDRDNTSNPSVKLPKCWYRKE